MARLRYFAIASLDGYIEDTNGQFGWAAPSDEVHGFVNDLVRDAGTHLYGRRMYETMAPWETDPSFAVGPPAEADFARIWQAAEKIVYSTTLRKATTTKTRLERHFDAGAVRDMVAAADADAMVGGANLAAQALSAGLVDELQLLLVPVIVGGGKPALPVHLHADLELLGHRRFENGTVFLRYAIQR